MSVITNDSAREIMFETLSVGDSLILQTRNNTYQFIITNHITRQGFLTGGVFGQISVPASLCLPFELRTGTQLRFHIESTVDCLYLKTTAITYLEVLRKNEMSVKGMMPTAELPRRTASYVH